MKDDLPEPQAEGGVSSTAWLLAVLAIVGLLAVAQVRHRWVSPRVLAKGSVASFTLRATADAVYDLRQSYAKQSEVARANYKPIYNKDLTIFYESREKIIVAAIAEPESHWGWETEAGDGGVPTDGRVARHPSRGDARLSAAPQARRSDGGLSDARRISGAAKRGDAGVDAGEEEDDDPMLRIARQRELESLIRGCFRILEPYYKVGVIADSEFPSQKDEIRIYSDQGTSNRGMHVVELVSNVYRFSWLQPQLSKRARQFFYKTNPHVVSRVIEYIFERLPANLTYARENKQVIDILDVTGVKVVLIRRSEVLIRRGQVVDTQRYERLRASAVAEAETSNLERTTAQLALLLALMMAFVICASEAAPQLLAGPRSQMIVAGGIVAVASVGVAGLALTDLHASAFPSATLPLIVAVVFGRVPALFVGIATAICVGIVWALDLGGFNVAMVGGVMGALVARRRRRAGILAAGVIIGIGQALAQEASRAIDGRPQTYLELLSAAEAFGGGLVSSVLATLVLPFVQRWLGQSSRGKLKVLADLDHPLLRRLRQQHPQTFVHTVRVADIADQAANAVGADRLLTRAGALFHDIGMLRARQLPEEVSVRERARAKIEHVAAGLRVAAENRLPDELVALIAEHHGTLELSALIDEARAAGEQVEMEDFSYGGPRPGSVEAAVLMVADRVEHEVSAAGARRPEESVDAVLSRLVTQMQFDRCGVTQSDLHRIRNAVVRFLRGNA
ncbi:MAG: HDIG domain-containing protein [Deltaproteobacteria bacterium]|nr:HDIG domain-containing protein [Deltaproteobacteria bacterium]